MSDQQSENSPQATAREWGIDRHAIGSLASRAAARALASAREELAWDAEPSSGPVEVAKLIRSIRLRHLEAEARGEKIKPNLTPIFIPPDKVNTRRGKFLARINAGRARVAALYAERENELGPA
jgi:hypothetical protein